MVHSAIFCHLCGAALPLDAAFCMACGTAATGVPSPAPVMMPPPAESEPSTMVRFPVFAALLGAVIGGFAGRELGQVICFLSAKSAGYESPGATPHVAALARSLEAPGPCGMIAGFAGFLATVFCLTRGLRWWSPLIGACVGAAAGAATGYMVGRS